MRGKQTQCRRYSAHIGITPADAGKTFAVRSFKKCRQDHPRGCGENRMMMSIVGIKLGSPPQVRGKLGGREHSGFKRGITPAGAGKTKIKPTYRPDKTDHPRRCGENDTIISWTAKEIGSPPQVRGKQCGQSLLRCTPGITPAGAGKTWQPYYTSPARQDHPRRCGENLI